ncbi:MAG: type II toxin-antitoxin system VapC family toxin [Candidatus Hodarchaeales archaeon]
MGVNYWRGRETTQITPQSSPRKSALVFLDTNFLMALGQFPSLNLSHELDRVIPQKKELVVIEPVIQELEKIIKEGKPKTKFVARLALDFVEKFCEKRSVTYFHKNIDFILLHYAEHENGIIATNDKKLRKLAKKKNIKTLYIRNIRFLELS